MEVNGKKIPLDLNRSIIGSSEGSSVHYSNGNFLRNMKPQKESFKPLIIGIDHCGVRYEHVELLFRMVIGGHIVRR